MVPVAAAQPLPGPANMRLLTNPGMARLKMWVAHASAQHSRDFVRSRDFKQMNDSALRRVPSREQDLWIWVGAQRDTLLILREDPLGGAHLPDGSISHPLGSHTSCHRGAVASRRYRDDTPFWLTPQCAQVQSKASQSFTESLRDFPRNTGCKTCYIETETLRGKSCCTHWNLSASLIKRAAYYYPRCTVLGPVGQRTLPGGPFSHPRLARNVGVNGMQWPAAGEVISAQLLPILLQLQIVYIYIYIYMLICVYIYICVYTYIQLA